MYEEIMPQIPVYMGGDAHRIFLNLLEHLPDKNTDRVKAFHTFKPAEKIKVSDGMTVTPFRVDHSSYDAYMFLIEAEGKRILHTGDFRAHGWTREGLWRVAKKLIKKVDVLITEGTMLSRGDEEEYSEMDLFMDATDRMRDNRNIFILCSSTNIDSIASFYQAAQECGRLFVCDGYQRSNLDIVSKTAPIGLYRFPKAKIYWDGREDCVNKMKAMGFCMLVRANGQFDNILKMFPDSLLIYSMWSGYLNEKHPARNEDLIKLVKEARERGTKVESLHTSGHATKETIIRVCKELKPGIVIPIHGEHPEKFKELGLSGCEIKVLRDGEMLSI
jgi:ribonuclease J